MWDRHAGVGLPTSRVARRGELGIALAALAALVLLVPGSTIIERERGEVTTAAVPFEQRWHVFDTLPEPEIAKISDQPIALEAPQDPVIEAKPAPAREADTAAGDEEPPEPRQAAAAEQYILYFNSPTHWTPVPLPASIEDARAPHSGNIRAEIEQAAMLFDLDIRMMKAFARIESGYRPKATTGKYRCLFQLSAWEFAKYWRGDIYDIRDCSIAAARKLATEAAQFEKDVGRRATAAEIYCIHQQGYQGCSFHYAAPHQLAWKNMYLTAEGYERGEAWARKAIWGNVPSDIKPHIKGGVDALTSAQFIAIWTERVERFMARKAEPPSEYVEYSSKSKAGKKVAQKAEKANARSRTAKKTTGNKVASR